MKVRGQEMNYLMGNAMICYWHSLGSESDQSWLSLQANNVWVLQRLAVSLSGISHSSLEMEECRCTDWLLGVFLEFSSWALWLFTFSSFCSASSLSTLPFWARSKITLCRLSLSQSLFPSPLFSLSLSSHVWSTWNRHLSPIIGGSLLAKHSTLVTNS